MSIGELYRAKRAAFRVYWETIRRYYPKNFGYALCDFALGAASFFYNPYRVCRKNGFVYGETPAFSFHRIADFCGLSSGDCWLELGSGRGKGCLWMAYFIGCRTTGIEKVSIFFWIARAIGRLSGMRHLSFVKGDIADADFGGTTCVYLYSTCMSDSEIDSLTKKMEALPSGAKVVSVSAPLPQHGHLKLAGIFPLSFPWGDTEGYLHLRI